MKIIKLYREDFVSVPSFGDSFFMKTLHREAIICFSVSVPSFGDSFFIKGVELGSRLLTDGFPSPHSGILFLSFTVDQNIGHLSFRFRPLIRGFFFYMFLDDFEYDANYLFPSPHSGILFL